MEDEFTLEDFEELCGMLKETQPEWIPWWERIPMTREMDEALRKACEEYLER